MAIPESPHTRLEMYLDAIAKGGGDITVESKTIIANGTVTAPSGKAYSPVTVNVANSYTAGDEGKVVSSGALVSQTAHAEVTENGTIDTTLNNSVVVNVQGSGSSPWTKIAEQDFTVSTTSSSETVIGTVNLDVNSVSVGDIFWVHIRDKAGKQVDYCYGSDALFIMRTANGYGDRAGTVWKYKSNNTYDYANIGWGVSPQSLSGQNKTLTVTSRYATGLTMNGIYKVDVYKLTPPFTMFE